MTDKSEFSVPITKKRKKQIPIYLNNHYPYTKRVCQNEVPSHLLKNAQRPNFPKLGSGKYEK